MWNKKIVTFEVVGRYLLVDLLIPNIYYDGWLVSWRISSTSLVARQYLQPGISLNTSINAGTTSDLEQLDQ